MAVAKDKYQTTVGTFNKLAEQYQAKYMDFDFYVDTYEAFCRLLPSGQASLFEIGCGPGNISSYLLGKRPELRLFGIDLAPNMVALARQNNPGARFEVMDSRQVDQVPGPFDAVLCGFCTPYLAKADVTKLVADCRKLLSEGGIFYLSTMEGEDSRSGMQSNSQGDQVYIHYYQLAFLEALLVANGFEIIEVKRKAFPVEAGEPVTDLFIYARAI